MLKQVVAEVGFGIPIQELFDIAFGTSTGKYCILLIQWILANFKRWYHSSGSLQRKLVPRQGNI